MITVLPPGDMFANSSHSAFINTTNTTGVMGAGIAAVCMKLFPEECKEYNRLCRQEPRVLFGGSLSWIKVHNSEYPHITHMFCLATKQEVSQPAKLEYVEKGLDQLVLALEKEKWIKSIGIPPLGCGYGGLNWNVVKPLILSKLENVRTDCEVYVYEQ